MEQKGKKTTKTIECILYVIGLIFIIIGAIYYLQDLKYTPLMPFKFEEHLYVGGDAYNYIISAARSTAVMIKSLIWIVLGSSSIIIGRTLSQK